ncbi:MAG: hypothetical protein IJJ98_07115 [Prevotella sp.]|nr:hypothetical protein [Prevotella sp.]
MMKTEQKQMVWMELYLAVVKCCEEDRSAHCDAFAVERRNRLGSVTRNYNTSGTAVFSAYYDPWGVQTVTTNTIGYSRGYCGHEMLNGFQLINMRSATLGDAFFLHCITKASKLERVTTWRKNGRMYDPYIARGRGVVWDYKKYPLNISKILSYFQYDNNYNRININYL